MLGQVSEGEADAAGGAVVGSGCEAAVRADELDTMRRRTVHEEVILFFGIIGRVVEDLEGAVEIAGGTDHGRGFLTPHLLEELVALPHSEENDDEAEGATPFGDDAAALEVEGAGQEDGEGGGDFPGVLFVEFQQLFREAGAAIERGFERGHGDGGEHGPNGRAKDQGAAAVAKADEGEDDGEDGEADLEFAIFVKDSGRDDGDEQAAERAAGRDEEKIGGQVARRGLELVELAVADHADDEERAGVAGDLEFHRGIAAGVEQADEAGDTDDEQG